jgi:hypothetical protein
MAKTAVRYCGTLKLSLRYVDKGSSYSARITELNDDARFSPVDQVRLAPVHNNLPVDSDQAWDLAAKACLNYLANDDDSVYNFADEDENYGFVIRQGN